MSIANKTVKQRMEEAHSTRAERTREIFAYMSIDAHKVSWPLHRCFAKLWCGKEIEKVNDELIEIFTTRDGEERKRHGLDHPWSLYLTPMLYRLYFWFSTGNGRLSGRLRPDAERALLELLWERTARKNDIHLTRDSTWWLVGSENHDVNLKVSSLLSSQIFMREPEYVSRVYPDLGSGGGWSYWPQFRRRLGIESDDGPEGRADGKDGKEYTARDHYEAWVPFLMEYIRERASKGFFVEVASSGYMRHTMSYLYDLYDYCGDEDLRGRTGMFLDLIWAEWAQDQLSGWRGGAKTRVHMDVRDGRDAMYWGSAFLLGGSGDATRTWFSQFSSDYELPEVVWQLALDREGLGSFAYISRKPGEEPDRRPRPPGTERTLLCDTDSRLLRYSWVTPDYILGTQMDHPGAIHSHLSAVARFQGMLFGTSPSALVYPRDVDVTDPQNWKMYTGQITEGKETLTFNGRLYRSVQHEHVLITQQSRGWTEANPEWFPMNCKDSRPFGVYFAENLEVVEEEGGWIFVKEGNAFLAVKVVLSGYAWNNQRTVALCEDRFSPIIFEAGRTDRYASLEEFAAAILNNSFSIGETVVPGWHTLTYTGAGPNAREIYFNAANNEIPQIDGQCVDYAPEQTFASPYIHSAYGSGVVEITKGETRLTLDFTD